MDVHHITSVYEISDTPQVREKSRTAYSVPRRAQSRGNETALGAAWAERAVPDFSPSAENFDASVFSHLPRAPLFYAACLTIACPTGGLDYPANLMTQDTRQYSQLPQPLRGFNRHHPAKPRFTLVIEGSCLP